MDPAKKTSYEPITKKLKKAGYKIGIVNSVTLDHATPAVFMLMKVPEVIITA